MDRDQRTEWQDISISKKEDSQTRLKMEIVSLGGREEVGILDSIPIDQLTDILGDISDAIGKSLERAKPKKAVVELGFEFGVESGQLVALIARGTGKANFKISLEWELK